MTKTMKTGIIAALTVVLIAVCCLFVGTLNKSAYAASQEQIEAFENHVKTNLAKEDDSMYTEDLFAESGYVLAFKRRKAFMWKGRAKRLWLSIIRFWKFSESLSNWSPSPRLPFISEYIK